VTPADLAALERALVIVGAAAGRILAGALIAERAMQEVGDHEPARLAALADLAYLHRQAVAADRPAIADFLTRCLEGLGGEAAAVRPGPGRPDARPSSDRTSSRPGRPRLRSAASTDDPMTTNLGRDRGGRGARENGWPSLRTRAPVRTPTRRKHRP
jgi:hypothetical protein